MKKLLTITILYLVLSMSQAWSLPKCEGSPLDIHNQKEIEAITWHNCEGIIFIKGLEEDPNALSKYDGEWQKGNQNGQGTSTFNDGAKYIGEWKNGLHHGKGTYIWADGTKYVGEHEFHSINGNGIMYYNDGRVSVGTWIEGEFFGKEYAPGEYDPSLYFGEQDE